MKILVYGWYHQNNIGDDLFEEAFRSLFPWLEFVFTENIVSEHQLQDVDAIFFGGGSFLVDAPRISNYLLSRIKEKKIFYIGIGDETTIHPVHQDLIKRARLVAIRSGQNVNSIRNLNVNLRAIPDLVYALKSPIPINTPKIDKSILILPNVAVIPLRDEPYWKHAAWQYFKSEFCHFLDQKIEENYMVRFLPMCTSEKEDDRWIAYELISSMRNRSNLLLLDPPVPSLAGISEVMLQYSTIITQRFHGTVLSEMLELPYVTIYHHDKLKRLSYNRGQFISYYNVSCDSLNNVVHNSKYTNILPIEPNIFKEFAQEVITLLQ